MPVLDTLAIVAAKPQGRTAENAGDTGAGEDDMAIFGKMHAALANKDAEAYLALYGDDAVFVRHQTGTTMDKPHFAEMIRKMLASDRTDMANRRCIYENDDILVVHSVNDYPDGSREAVLMACTLKDGKIRRVETGATPLAK
jgi:ketosteroid isomerase-like protein